MPGSRVWLLGLITIAVYGSWYYAFGVLLDPIIADTGWPEPTLTAAFGASILIGGVGAIGGGLLLDRYGSRVVFGLAGAAGAFAFLAASSAGTAGVFSVSAAIGGGIFGALGFYHVTQTVAVRIAPRNASRAIALLTIWGAFASAVFIPLTALLLSRYGWRSALTVVTLIAAALLGLGALTFDTKLSGRSGEARAFAEVRDTLRIPPARRFLISQAMAGMAASVVLAYQVPAMTAAGLSLAAASFWAGFRGFAQLAGRLPLMPIVNRLGVTRTMRIAYLSFAVGVMALAFAGTPLLAAVYALAAGFGIGALSPLVGMFTNELFGRESLGTAMGTVSLVFFGAGALGAPLAGLVASSTGSRAVGVIGAAVLAALAAIVLSPPRADRT
jgi:MFS family permease